MIDQLILSDSIDVSSVPDEIRILPLGTVESSKGDFKVTDESVACIIKTFRDKRIDLVIDYEHQTMHDVEAPAAGWIKELKQGENSLLAKVEWTQKAKNYLLSKEYKYLSPVVVVSKKDKSAKSIHSVALTNTPAITGMYAIVNSEGDANQDYGTDIIQKPENKENDTNEVDKLNELSDIAKLLGIEDHANIDNILKKINELLRENAVSVKELKDYYLKEQEREIDGIVQFALKNGKITSHQKNEFRKLAEIDPQSCKKYILDAPTVVPRGKLDIIEPPSYSNNWEINKLLGISDEDTKRYQ